MEIFIAKSKNTGDRKAFEIIKNLILKKPDSLVGLAVGKTTDYLYELISKDCIKNPEHWKKIKVFQIDENLGVRPNSPLSFNHEIKRELKSLFKIIDKKNVFLIDGTKNPKKIIKEAYRFLKKNKGIDLIVLGLGPEHDPHIAYNTTGLSSLNSRLRVVNLHEKIISKLTIYARQHGLNLQKTRIPTKGITLGIKDILHTKKALLIAYGKDKTKSIQNTLKGRVDLKKSSASALLLHKNLQIVLDKAASKGLNKKLLKQPINYKLQVQCKHIIVK